MANDELTGVILKSLDNLRTDIRGLYQKIDSLGKVYVTKEVHDRVVKSLEDKIESLESDRNKLVWGVLSAVLIALMSLVIDTTKQKIVLGL